MSANPRRAGPLLRHVPGGLVLVALLAAVLAIGVYVHETMNRVREGLPAQVLEQQRDVAYMVKEISILGAIAQQARRAPGPEALEDVLVQVRESRSRLEGIRRTYDFDNLVGASAMHAILNPALLDVERWCEAGIQEHGPTSPAVAELVHLRIESAQARLAEVFEQANAAAVSLIENEAARLERFRDSLFVYLTAFALLALGVGVLFMRQRTADHRLMIERQRLVDSIESIGEGFALYDSDDRLVLCNERFRDLDPTGGERIVTGKRFEDILRALCAEPAEGMRSGTRLESWIRERLAHHRAPVEPFELRLPTGRVIRVSEQKTGDGGTVGVYTDITDQKRAHERLAHMATHDPLTGLPNRSHLQTRLEEVLARARRQQQRFAVMFFDLDHFKRVNDTFGHAAGDALLRQIARALQRCLRENDVVVRLGGDEFAAVVENVRSWSEVATTAERTLEALRAAYEVEGAEVFISTSIGISLYPDDGDDVSALLRDADAACYHAKSTGRDNYQFYTERMNAEASERVEIERRLRGALEHDGFTMFYRPRLDLETGELAALEARPCVCAQGLPDVDPDRYRAVAEDAGLSVAIGEWTLETACAHLRSWGDLGLSGVPVSVHLAPRQFRLKGLAQIIERVVRGAGLSSQSLTLEIMESTILEEGTGTLRTLDELHGAGYRILVDDFGVGYSSLTVLRQLPLDALKIDASFTLDITSNENDRAIVAAVAAMAHRLRLRVIAEGIDSQEKADLVNELGCHEAQGPCVGNPMSPGQVEAWLQSRLGGSVTPITRSAARLPRGETGSPG